MVFVGREREWNELEGALDAALRGEGGLHLLGGEPGIGKTRLAEEVGREAGRRGARVFWGRCWEDLTSPSYWPWTQILRSYGLERVEAELGEGIGLLVPLLPELGPERRGEIAVGGAGVSPESERFRVFETVSRFLRRASSREPLLLVFDDLHAADVSSLLLLELVARELSEIPLLVLGTYRDAEVKLTPLAARVLGDLGRFGRRTVLEGLTRQDVARMIEDGLSLLPTAGLVDAVYRKTEGNPFYVDEFIHVLAAQGGVAADASLDVPLPESVRALILQRLDPLPQSCREALSIAAVVGVEVSADILARILERPGEEVLDLLQLATTAGLLVEHGALCWRFAHGLVRDTLYEDLGASRRARAHARVAEVLEEGAVAGEKPLAELAHHYAAAGPLAPVEKAVLYGRRAGERARERLAYEEAAEHFRRTLRLLDHRTERQPEERCELLLGLGAARVSAGDLEAARKSFLEAAALARELGDVESFVTAVIGAGGGVMTAPEGPPDEQVVALLEEALRMLPAGDSDMRASLLCRLAVELYYSHERERREDLSAQAVEVARRAAGERTLAFALSARHFILWGYGGLAERAALAEEILTLGTRIGNRDVVLQGTMWRALDELEAGRIGRAEAEIASFRSLAEDTRQPQYLGTAALLEGTVALIRGRLGRVESLAQEALAHMAPLGGSAARRPWALMISLRREQGRLAELEPALIGFAESFGMLAFRAILTMLYTESGRREEARQELERLAADEFGGFVLDVNWLISMAYLAETCVFLGDRDCAATLRRLIDRHAGTEDRVVLGVGPLSYIRGILAGLLGERDEAERELTAALDLCVRMDAPVWQARVEVEYGAMCRRSEDSIAWERCRPHVEAALAESRELGLAGIERRAASLLEGTRDGNETGEEPAGARPLFRREGDYWTIGFDGPVFRLKDLRGLLYVRELLRAPGRELHVSELLAAAHPPPPREAATAAAGAGTADEGAATLDPRAKAEYRERLQGLREQLEEARSFNDAQRAARLQAEIDFIAEELASALGLWGRDRKTGSQAERTRVSVTKAVRVALRKIAENDPVLGQHLRVTIRTGTFCSYNPDPRQPPDWQL